MTNYYCKRHKRKLTSRHCSSCQYDATYGSGPPPSPSDYIVVTDYDFGGTPTPSYDPGGGSFGGGGASGGWDSGGGTDSGGGGDCGGGGGD